MLLAIDIGNTNITLGLYQGENLSAKWRMATSYERMPDEYGLQIAGFLNHNKIDTSQLHGIFIASVVPPLTDKISDACTTYLKISPMIFHHNMQTGIKLAYENPSTIGADRIVDAAAAKILYALPACIVDFGTATTFDAVSRDAEYLGGAIAPGINIGAEALFERTAQLPKINLAIPEGVIGKNTVHAMQSGLIFGYVGLVEGMVARFKTELGQDTTIIATGGLANMIAEIIPCIDHVAPWLTLDGIRLIWEMNRNHE
ncbi:MAG: type III pantothenate kinase [Anaerolineaceae bacterium]|nr:type III pantothenate kinase [Anaerolineaceae bacterium]